MALIEKICNERVSAIYAAIGPRVMLGTRAICTAVSNTMAKRIAAALNEHKPDRRGI